MVIGEEKKAILSAALNGTDLPITRLLTHYGRKSPMREYDDG